MVAWLWLKPHIRSSTIFKTSLVAVATLLLSSQLVLAQFSQQGPKLVGTGAVGAAEQGSAVALSATGNTAIVGGFEDNSRVGAAWVYTRSGGVWTQQGNKLVANDAVGAALQGYSVALSSDGNTAIVGGPFDNAEVGAAWVYTRSSGAWSQQRQQAPNGVLGSYLQQGNSVAPSADGNTAIVGGPGDAGGAWVYSARRRFPHGTVRCPFALLTSKTALRWYSVLGQSEQ
jgi:hypothetical protein